jgi:chromosome segregation ATPase
MGEERKTKKLFISKIAQKIMEEIKEKAENPETQLKALELIEKHLEELPMHAFYITLDLSRSEQKEIRGKAEVILEKYYEKNPEFRELKEKIDTFKKNMEQAFSPMNEVVQAITAQQRILQKLPLQAIAQAIAAQQKIQQPLIKLGEIDKLYGDWSTKLLEIQKRLYPKIELPKINIPEEVLISSESHRFAIIEAKLNEISKDIQELKKSKDIEKEEYEKVKKKLRDLEEDVEKAYQ